MSRMQIRTLLLSSKTPAPLASEYPYQKPAQALNRLRWNVNSSNDNLPRLSKAGPILQPLNNIIPQAPHVSRPATQRQHPQTPPAQHASLNLELVPSQQAFTGRCGWWPATLNPLLKLSLRACLQRANALFPQAIPSHPATANTMHLV